MEPSPLTELWPRGRSLGKSDVFVWNSFRSGPGSASIVQGWGRTSTKVPSVLGHGQVGLKTGILPAEPFVKRFLLVQTLPGVPFPNTTTNHNLCSKRPRCRTQR